MNTLVGYTATVQWGEGGGRGVSVGGVSQLRPLNVLNHCPLLSLTPERDKKQEVM